MHGQFHFPGCRFDDADRAGFVSIGTCELQFEVRRLLEGGRFQAHFQAAFVGVGVCPNGQEPDFVWREPLNVGVVKKEFHGAIIVYPIRINQPDRLSAGLKGASLD